MATIILTIYGILLFSGAYFGSKAGSKVSLYMGVSTGLLILIAVYWSLGNPAAGFTMAAVLSGLLSATFLIRLIKTKKMMPSGMLMSASILAFIISLLKILN